MPTPATATFEGPSTVVDRALRQARLAREDRFQHEIGRAIYRVWRALRHRRSLRQRLTLMLGLAALLEEVAARSGDLDAMCESVRVLEQAAAAVDVGHPSRAALLVNSACGADRLYLMTGEAADAENSVSAVERAYAAINANTADRAEMLATLCAVLVVSGLALPRPEILDGAVDLGRQAVDCAEPDALGMATGNLASALHVRYEQRGAAQDLADALRAAEDSVTASDPDGHYRAGRLAELGHILGLSFDVTGSPATAARSVQVLRAAVALTPSGSPEVGARIATLASSLRNSDISGSPGALEEAVVLMRDALAAPPDDQSARFALHQHGAIVLSGWAERTRDSDTAFEAQRCAKAALTDAGDPKERAMASDTLATVLHTCYELGSGPDVLDEAVTASQTALADNANSSFDRIGYSGNLGVGHQLRYLAAGSPADLDAAIEAHCAAASALPPNHVDRAIYLNNLGITLRLRHERTGNSDDLDAAVDAGQEAVRLAAPGRTDLPGRLGNLAVALQTRFQWHGDLADLDAAIDHGRTAVQTCPQDHLHLAGSLANLGLSLRLRYDCLGARADIDESVDCLREALLDRRALAERPAALTNLGASLFTHYRLTSDEDVLRAAIAATAEAVAGTSADHPEFPDRLNNLVVQQLELPDVAAAGEQLRSLVAAARRAVGALDDGHADWPAMCSSLALALHGLNRASDDRNALDEAAAIASGALADMPAHHPDRSRLLTNLALVVNTRFTATGDSADRHTAIGALRAAAANDTSAVVDRIDAAAWLGGLAARNGDPSQAAEAFEWAVALLPDLSPHRLRHRDAHRWLGEYQGLAADAAALSIDEGRPQRAVELLELGRGVLLDRSLRLDQIGRALRQTDTDLADRIERLRTALDVLGTSQTVHGSIPGRPGNEPATPEHAQERIVRARLLEHRRDLAAQLQQAVAQASNLPGMSGLLAPPTLPTLLAVASQGPVVLVNVSQYRCDALALTAAGLVTVPLPDLTPGLVADALTTLPTTDFSDHRSEPIRSDYDRRTVDEALTATLDMLWTAVARPVLTELYRLGHLEPDHAGLRRLWWVPTGLLALLPLHAATAREELICGQIPASSIVASYTPTTGALLQARVTSAAAPTSRHALVIGPETAGRMPLPAANAEAALVATRLGTDLHAQAASRDEFLSELGQCTWLHLALHARFVDADPSASHVLLPGGDTVAVSEIAALPNQVRELAYLSACETTSTSAALADEAVHLTAAFQLAGFPQAIGTQWVVNDRVALRVARAVYDRLTPQPVSAVGNARLTVSPFSAAAALHAALASVRARYPPTVAGGTPPLRSLKGPANRRPRQRGLHQVPSISGGRLGAAGC
jgi:tetratricopeptide (TPR) repeat protein